MLNDSNMISARYSLFSGVFNGGSVWRKKKKKKKIEKVPVGVLTVNVMTSSVC